MRNGRDERIPSLGRTRRWARIVAVVGTAVALSVALAVSRSSQQPIADPQAVVRFGPVRAIGAIQPRLSPDGRKIAVSYQGSIGTVPVEGGTMTRLTNGTGFDIAPVWSPDGRRIAFVNTPSMSAGSLRVIDASTGTAVPLPKPPAVMGTIAYQKLEFDRDGSRVLGVFRYGGRNPRLSWYSLKTGGMVPVATLQRWSRFALSNDGRRIVYTTTQNVDAQQGGNDGQAADLWIAPAVIGKPRKLTRFPARIHDLCFSADDKSLFLVSELGGVHYDLWRISLADPVRSRRKLTFGQADEHQPSVSRDGRLLAYTDNREGLTSIMLRNLTTGDERTVRIAGVDFRVPIGRLRISVRDAVTKKPLTARVTIERKDGKFFAPLGRLYRVLNAGGHFYCDGSEELALPAGQYRLRAFRGPEYKVLTRDFRISAGTPSVLDVPLARWTHNFKRGWYSGENHIHANYGYGEWYNSPRTMLRQCVGEDLNVCNFMVANSDSDGVFDREFFRGRPDIRSTAETILYWNQEFRSTIWGHMTLVNLKQVVEPVFTGFKDTTNPWDVPTNSDIADKTHLQNGLVNFTHVAQNPDDPYKNPYTGKSIPVDAALGKIDSLDLNGSYAGTVPLWYRLLNCGFRLPASAGTDVFLNRINSRVPGGDRVYVQVRGGLTYDKWIEGLRGGRTFVTSGPMLQLSVNGQGIGDTVRLAAPGTVGVKAKAVSQFPLSRVEVISNGRVVAKGKFSTDRRTCTIDARVKIATSGWIAIRATGPNHPDSATRLVYAHTSPVYIDVKDTPFDARKDAAYFLKWIDRLSLAVRVRDRIPGEKNKTHVRNQLEAARRVYRKLLTRPVKE